MTPMAQMYDDVRTIIQTQGTFLTEIGAEAAGPLVSPEEILGQTLIFWVE